MTLEELVRIAEVWDNLGAAIQEQAKAVIIDGADYNEQNPNALRYVVEWLREVADLDDDASIEAEEWMMTLEEHLQGCFHEPGNLKLVRGNIFVITLGHGWCSRLTAWVKEEKKGDVLGIDDQHLLTSSFAAGFHLTVNPKSKTPSVKIWGRSGPTLKWIVRMNKMDTLWQDVTPENSNFDLVISLKDGRRFEVLAIWIGPGGYKGISGRVPVVQVAGLPDWCKTPCWPEDGTLPYKRFRGELQLSEIADHAGSQETSLWNALEVSGRRRARQKGLIFFPRAYNSEPSEGPCYTLYNVPDLDVDGIEEMMSGVCNGQL